MNGLITELDDNGDDNTKLSEFLNICEQEVFFHHPSDPITVSLQLNYMFALSTVVRFSAADHTAAESGGAAAETVTNHSGNT